MVMNFCAISSEDMTFSIANVDDMEIITHILLIV